MGILLNLYRGYLLTIAADKLSSDVVAKVAPSDLVQNTLLQASQAFAGFEGSTELELRMWLRQILLRETIDVHRHYRKCAIRDISREVPLHHGSDRNAESLDAMATTPSPSTLARASEDATILERAMQTLKVEYRHAIQLRNFEQLDFEAIGMRLGRSTEAARKLWGRAIQNLAVELRSRDSGSARSL